MKGESCYRVKMHREGRVLDIIVYAPNAVIAHEKARTLAPSLLAKRLPWLMEHGRTKPQPVDRIQIVIEKPRPCYWEFEYAKA